MTDIAQRGRQSYRLLASDQERRLVSRWRLGIVAFYGTLLALVLAFAAMSKAPRERQADRASDDFVTHSISAPRP
ncbi:hypothetical protein [Bradyrhizobium sp. WSM1417]|uniref:hypothetical protein n=1 Tax=Bradyrhizobium sp. WSM1417 TaxID=754500 RepID=UPI000482D7AC|nr:hypothetical protein [Bradyrhizobium sp. WSM1417]